MDSTDSLKELHDLVNEQLLRHSYPAKFKQIVVPTKPILDHTHNGTSADNLSKSLQLKSLIDFHRDLAGTDNANKLDITSQSLIHSLKQKKKQKRKIIIKSSEYEQKLRNDDDIFGNLVPYNTEQSYVENIGPSASTGSMSEISLSQRPLLPRQLSNSDSSKGSILSNNAASQDKKMRNSSTQSRVPSLAQSQEEFATKKKLTASMLVQDSLSRIQQEAAQEIQQQQPQQQDGKVLGNANESIPRNSLRRPSGLTPADIRRSISSSIGTPTGGGVSRRVRLDDSTVFKSAVLTPREMTEQPLHQSKAKRMVEETLSELESKP